jgi:hypothetical protein
MDRDWGESHYTSVFVEDKTDGFGGFELYQSFDGKKKKVASVIFWDACGQYCVETFGSEVPLGILEELISETKTRIKVRGPMRKEPNQPLQRNASTGSVSNLKSPARRG